MTRVVPCLVFASVAFAQTPWQKHIDETTKAYRDAHNQGRFEEAAAKRDDTRALVAAMPADAPEFAYMVRSVAQLYANGGMTAKARGVVQEALARSTRSNASQLVLLDALAGFWEQDQNLLRALTYREKAAAILESGPVAMAPQSQMSSQVTIRSSGFFRPSGASFDLSSVYQAIAELNRRLGRPAARAAALTKVRALAKDDLSMIAGLYLDQGQTEEAVSTYRQAILQVASNPNAPAWEQARPYQQLASLYEGDQRYAEAAAVLKQAIDAVGASARPEARSQSNSLRETLARVLNREGDRAGADEIYQRLLAESAASPSRSQTLMNYANYLNGTGRGAQSLELLRNYLAAHADLEPWEETNLLYGLANASRSAGDLKAAEEYQHLAAEKQPPAVPQITIGSELQAAQTAARSEKAGDPVDLAIKTMDAASRAIDRDQIAWQIPNLASQLALKSPDKSELLYRHLLEIVGSWSSDTVQPQLQALNSYARFLTQQKPRHDEVPAAIERYKNAIVASQGPDTSALENVLHIAIEFETMRGSSIRAIPAVRDLLALEESLSGTTSEPYLRAVETAAATYESAGDQEHALALRRQSVAIADLALPPEDARRGLIRIQTAFALANHGQVDEAETLANQAASLFDHLHPPQSKQYAPQLQQIRTLIDQRQSPR